MLHDTKKPVECDICHKEDQMRYFEEDRDWWWELPYGWYLVFHYIKGDGERYGDMEDVAHYCSSECVIKGVEK